MVACQQGFLRVHQILPGLFIILLCKKGYFVVSVFELFYWNDTCFWNVDGYVFDGYAVYIYYAYNVYNVIVKVNLVWHS